MELDGPDDKQWLLDSFAGRPGVWALGGWESHVKVRLDYDNTVSESNENNNYYERTITVSSAGNPDLAAYKPSNWNNNIPVGTTQLSWDAAHSGTEPYYNNQTLYFNWGSANLGATSAAGYKVHVEVSGTGGGSWDWPGLTTAGGYWTCSATDQAFGPLAAGTHTLKVWLDYDNTVSESNEGNNYYERTITVSTVAPTEYYAECADNSGFSSPRNSGWIQQTQTTFNNLAPGQTYWYRVKARRGTTESGWSNVEFSRQETFSTDRDFNSDGKADILWRHTAYGDINVWFMNGATVTGDAWLPRVTSQQWQIAGIGDFNGDGNADLLWRYTPSGDMNLWFMNGSTVTGDVWLPRVSNPQWQIAGIGDFNKDSKSDIVWRNSASGDINVWFMNGGTVTSDAWLPRVIDQQWQIAGIGDFNGDGGGDIVWKYLPSGDLNVWLMDGTAVTSDAWLPRVADPQWQINAIGDFNGDHNAEIVWRHTVYGTLNIWFMNGASFVSDGWLPRVADLQWKIFGPK